MNRGDKVFVTGATGFIGTRLVQALTDRGCSVRALSRQKDPQPPPAYVINGGPLLRELVQLVPGDIADVDALARGMEGCSHVFHLAGYAKNWAPDPKIYHDVNVQGLTNVLDAAERQGVERVVVTSTVMTFGPTPPGVVGDEDMPRTTDRYLTEYERTKTLAEREALERAGNGCPVVIVNPTRVYGPGHLTEGNALSLLIDDYDRGRMPFLLNGGVNVGNYVLVDDVVDGFLLAMEHGRIGQRYILGGDNASLKQLFRTIDQVSNKRHFQIPIWKLGPLFYAWLLKRRAQWLGIYPQITPGWVRTFLADWAYCCDKAKRELGYRPTPLVDGIRTTYEWLLRVREKR